MVSRLRRSWLIFATAAPRPASRSFCRSAAVSRTSRSCSAVSASRSSRAPLSRRDDPARVLGIVAVGGHVLDHPPDRPHDQPLHREEQQRRGRERDRRARCRGCAGPCAIIASRSGHSCSVTSISLCAPCCVRPITRMIRSWSAANTRSASRISVSWSASREVEGLVRPAPASGSPAPARARRRAAAPRSARPPSSRSSLSRSGATASSGVGEQRQRRELRQLEAVLQVVHAEPRHRRHEDQHLGDHHEEDRQAQEASGKGVEDHADH